MPAVHASPSMADPAVAGAVVRLTAEFGGRFRRRVVQRVLTGARRDLAGVPPGALPELVERLAKQRLER